MVEARSLKNPGRAEGRSLWVSNGSKPGKFPVRARLEGTAVDGLSMGSGL
jgi:hypothetical protein